MRNKSHSKSKGRRSDPHYVENTEQGKKYMLTEVNSPLYQPEFERTTSPGDRVGLKFLSTKNTTEEAEDGGLKTFNELFSKTLNKGMLKDLSVMDNKPCNRSTALDCVKATETFEKIAEDSFQSVVHAGSLKTQSKSSFKYSVQKDDKAPSMKDVEGNSCNTTERKELMEDSLNTCSFQKNSTAKKSSKKSESSVRKEESFIGTLANAINYFTTPQLKANKSLKPKKKILNYSTLVSPKNKPLKQSLSQMGKKCSKFMSKKMNCSMVNKSTSENSQSFVDFRSPQRIMRTNLNKFNADKVLKTENDAFPEEQTFYFPGGEEVKDSLDEDIIEDSMNKDSEDSNLLRSKVKQLECEVLRLQNVVKEERSKNKELELTLNYFQQLYKKEKSDKDEAQSAFNQVLGSLCVSDQSNGGRKSEELGYTLSPTFKLTTNHFNEKIMKNTAKANKATKSRDRQVSVENKGLKQSSIQQYNISKLHTSVQSPKIVMKKHVKQGKHDEDKKKKIRKAKSRKEERKHSQKLNQSMNNPNLYNQVTQETCNDELNSTLGWNKAFHQFLN